MLNWRVNLAVLWLGNFLVMGSGTMVTPFLPLYIQDLGVTDLRQAGGWASVVFAAHFVTLFFFQPLWGKLADRYGRKPMLLRAGFGMSLVIALMGLVQAPWQLLLLRLLNGAVAGFSPAATAVLSTNTPKERLGFAIGMLQSGNIAGMITGPLFGGLLAEWIGFRQVFVVTGLVTLLAAAAMAVLVKDNFTARQTDGGGDVSVLSGLKILWKIKVIPPLYAASMGASFALTATLPFLPLFVQQLDDSGAMLALQVGLVSSVTGISNLLFSPLLGRWGDTIGTYRILLLALTGASAVFVLHALAAEYWQLLALRLLLGVFLGGLIPSVRTLIKRHTPAGMETRSYSFDTSAVSLGSIAGPLLAGAVFGLAGVRGIFVMSAVVLVLNVWVMGRMKRTMMDNG